MSPGNYEPAVSARPFATVSALEQDAFDGAPPPLASAWHFYKTTRRGAGRRDNYVPAVSALEQDIIEVDHLTKDMLKMLEHFQHIFFKLALDRPTAPFPKSANFEINCKKKLRGNYEPAVSARERDVIEVDPHAKDTLKMLQHLQHVIPALGNGGAGTEMETIKNQLTSRSLSTMVYSYRRN
ncbi:40S ribosomal protein S17 [Pseudolycoriella hygida]|uniref:40S ribosomal protein S17 n=1 Tax=Pseudolycoriella hygida TaxID=35572 RepID=A0A9Q0NFU7_9DIPT|nr:40S ribosomal protein S17 [Pseudolycoriella hygida]